MALLNNRFRLVRQLGEGTDGLVWLAEDISNPGAQVAIKLVGGLDQAARDRLAGEFRRMGQLDHPALVTAHQLDRVAVATDGLAIGTPFFSADYIDGVDPRVFMAGCQPATTNESLLRIAEDLAGALAHVHTAGLLHRDVKPSNVLVSQSAGEIRAYLLDLGLGSALASGGSADRARGTLAYMSREALSGEADPRSDLYALGATLFESITGHAVFDQTDPRALVRAICDGRVRPVSELAPELDRELCGLIDGLLAPLASDRPSSASVVLDDLARIREHLSLGEREGTARLPDILLPPALVGRDREVAEIAAAIGASAIASQIRVVRVIGPPGCGRGAVIQTAVRAHQLSVVAERAAEVDLLSGSIDELAMLLGVEVGDESSERSSQQFADRLVAAAVERSRQRPCVMIVVAGFDDPRASDVAGAAAASEPANSESAFLAVVPLADVSAQPASSTTLDVAVGPLSLDETRLVVASMFGRAAAEGWVSELWRSSGGIPRFIVETVRAAASAAGVDAADTVPIEELLGDGDQLALERLVVKRVARLPAAVAEVIEATAVLASGATIDALAAVLDRAADDVYAACAELSSGGFLAISGQRVVMPSAVHRSAVHRALPAARRRSLHRAALEWLERAAEPDVVAVAAHVIETGPASRVVADCLVASRALTRRGRPLDALTMATAAASAATGSAASEALVEVAELAVAVGHYEDAVSAATRAARTREPTRKRRAQLALARAEQKRGRLDEAETVLAKLRSADPGDEEAAGQHARLLVSRGRYAEALAVAARPSLVVDGSDSIPRGRAVRLEANGLAQLYENNIADADQSFRALASWAEVGGDDALMGRALGLQGMVAQADGDIAKAAQLYARAGDHARLASDAHSAAVYDLNLATAASERGRFGEALEALSRASSALRRIGQVAELAAALYNRGVALLALGEIEAARHAAADARARAEAHGTPQMQVYARLLEGDVHRRDGDRPAAIAAYQGTIQAAQEAGLAKERFHATLNLAETLAEQNDPGAREQLEGARLLAGGGDDSHRLALSDGRVTLLIGGDHARAASVVEAAASASDASGHTDLAWRCAVTAARLRRSLGDTESASRNAETARSDFEEIVAASPEARRPGLRTDPDARALAAVEGDLRIARPIQEVSVTSSPKIIGSESQLRRLLSLSRRLNSELRLDPLLDDVIDTAIEMTSAERGFLLLNRPGDSSQLDVVVARNIEHSVLEGEELRLSRSIAARSARTGEVVLTLDAAFDQRFGAAESVAAMGLRSVLAVPLRQKGRIIGTIYVDHRFRRGAFDDEAVELTRELADIAAVAIENARLVEQNQRRQQEITALNDRLADDLGRTEAELATVKSRLGAGSDLRYGYDHIIGRSAPMLDLLRVVDRAIASALPVVVYGESGTGKELIARALHDNGARRDQAFVAINCGAVAEQLLESELFGHVRGAFTGADRDRRGLFEVASGGTLFLDEVADMSLAMQAKLLRVLQEGEIRRVGGENTVQVDVRVIAASNRRLSELVEAGGFREDLFYRLNVLSVTVPPLRDRIEDLPALAQHVLAKLAVDGAVQKISKDALVRLCAYGWPGNVRELENELARASALADGIIGVRELSSRFANATVEHASTATDDLLLRPRVESLERTLVERALKETSGNQSAAAKLLGLSRYGLQKKLKRYGISRA